MRSLRFRPLLLTTIATLLAACAGTKEHREIDVGNLHLEDYPAGQWLKLFDLDYSEAAPNFKKQLRSRLEKSGVLVQEMDGSENGNSVHSRVWSFKGKRILEQYYRGGIWEGPEVFPPQEYYQGELLLWITIDLGNGVPASELIPNVQPPPEPWRRQHFATVLSKTDEARLFLFGTQGRCTRVSLF